MTNIKTKVMTTITTVTQAGNLVHWIIWNIMMMLKPNSLKIITTIL